MNKTYQRFIEDYGKSDDYKEYEATIKKCIFEKSNYTIDTDVLDGINILINILVCLFCIFVFKWKIWVYPLVFLITDIILVQLDKLIISFLYKKQDKPMTLHEIDKTIVKLESIKINKKKKIKRLQDLEIYVSYDRVNEITLIDDKIMFYKRKIREMKKDMETETIIVDKKENDSINSYKNLINELEKNINLNLSSEYIEYIQNSLNLSKRLIKELNNNRGAYEIVHSTFHIYLTELVGVITQIGNLDKEQQKDYREILLETVDEYENHILRMTERIKNYNQRSIDININTLLSELKEVE